MIENTYTVYKIEYQGEVKYIGKTCDYKRRKWKHLNGQGAIPVDVDLNDVEIMPIERFNTNEEAVKREDELICEYNTIDCGWNVRRSGLIEVSDRKAYQREYYNTPEWKEYMREYKRNWKKQYQQTPEYKTYQRERQRQYRQTPEYKAYMQQYRLRKKEEKQLQNK